MPETQIWNASRKVLKLNHTLLQTVLWTLATTAAKFANILVLTLFISYLYVWFYVSSSFCPIWFLLSWFPYLGMRFFSQWLCPIRFFPSVTLTFAHFGVLTSQNSVSFVHCFHASLWADTRSSDKIKGQLIFCLSPFRMFRALVTQFNCINCSDLYRPLNDFQLCPDLFT